MKKRGVANIGGGELTNVHRTTHRGGGARWPARRDEGATAMTNRTADHWMEVRDDDTKGPKP